jgi:hypothetical protein
MNQHRTEPKSLTIALTNAPPVRIETDRWPVIASAKRICEDEGWILVVRRHEDCRAIVYAEEYLAGMASDPDYSPSQAGELLVPGTKSMEEQAHLIATKIVEVGKSLNFPNGFIQQCIASMAPEELD